MGLFYFLFVYVLGGITFVPLVVAAIFLYAHLTLPLDPKRFAREYEDPLRDSSDEDKYIRSGGAASLDEQFRGKHDSDLAEGYYAVCREYVPGGVNGKPPERVGSSEHTPEQSPSVYQVMYRNLFDRRQAPTLEPNKNAGRFAKKPRNVFYVVLRHSHLMLYDDEYQSEVRHVISLAHHRIDLYGGGNEIPEGELWIKRNAIRLVRNPSPADVNTLSKPFFFFSENCSDKEDFYHAMLQNQERNNGESDGPPSTLAFDNQHIVNLIQKLHSSEEQFQTRWLNALIGRYFLGIYKTRFIEDVVRMKITKKIARVKKPAFLTGIILRKISMGHSAPLITNPRLRDLTIDGNTCVEADVRYEGGVRVEIAATIRIDLGARFKTREVELGLALTCKKLSGRAMLRLKPPPSNRLWFTFETMPKVEMTVEPIWGSRQITYGVVLRQIESRIREVLAETIVFPFWDDIPFLDTEKLRYRGGIWTEDGQGQQPTHDIHVPDEAPKEDAEVEATVLDQPVLNTPDDRSASSPALVDSTSRNGLVARKAGKHVASASYDSRAGQSSGVEKQRPEMPRPIRSTSSAAAPTLSTNNADTVSMGPGKSVRDATSLMREISNRSQPSSPPDTPQAPRSQDDRSKSPFSRHRKSFSSVKSASSSLLSLDGAADLSASQITVTEPGLRDPSPSASLGSHSSTQSRASVKLAKLAESLTPSEAHQAQLAAISAAAANASRSWTWGSKKSKHSNSPSISSTAGSLGTSPSLSSSGNGVGTGPAVPSAFPGSNGSHTVNNEPYGRGRPLPPPGTPLPPPERASTFAGAASSWMGSLKRKNVSNVQGAAPMSSSLPERRSPRPDRQGSVLTISSTGSGDGSTAIKRRPVPPPPLPARRASRAGLAIVPDEGQNDVVIVSAPPLSPSSEHEDGDYAQHDTEASHNRGDLLIDLDDDDTDAHLHQPEPVLSEAELVTPLADGRKLVGKPELELWNHEDLATEHSEIGKTSREEEAGREELTASEMMARESINAADLEQGPL